MQTKWRFIEALPSVPLAYAPVAPGDRPLEAFGKLQGQINATLSMHPIGGVDSGGPGTVIANGLRIDFGPVAAVHFFYDAGGANG